MDLAHDAVAGGLVPMHARYEEVNSSDKDLARVAANCADRASPACRMRRQPARHRHEALTDAESPAPL
ncbi:hypothetical protein GCM10009739_26510 [Microbacterium ulmi]